MQDGRHRGGSAGLGEILAGLGEAARVARDETRPPDVAQLEEEEDDTLETNASTAMRRATIAEAIEVILHCSRVDAGLPHALLEQGSVVDTLTTREDLLAAEEEIIRVGQLLYSEK